MFQKHFNHVLVLTALVLMAYSVPAVRDTLSAVNTTDGSNSAAVMSSVENNLQIKSRCPSTLACTPIPPQPAGCPDGYMCTVVAPVITVVSPNSGDMFKDGQTMTVTWNTRGIPDSQKLDITLNIPVNSSSVGQAIAKGVPNTGSYSWKVKTPAPFYASEINQTIYPTGKYTVSVVCPATDRYCNFTPNFGQSGVFTIVSVSVPLTITGPSSVLAGSTAGSWTLTYPANKTSTYYVIWGDSSATSTVTATSGVVTLSHAYLKAGTYTITGVVDGIVKTFAVTVTAATPKPFAWYADQNVALCWSAGSYETTSGCSVGHGLTYPDPNALNAGSLIGAKEYCAGLNSGDGRIWRLPNTQELMAGLDSTYGGDGVAATGQPGGFQAGKFYWTDTSFAITGGDANRMFIMSGSAGQSGASQQNILKNATAGSVQFASFPGVYARCVTGDYSTPTVVAPQFSIVGTPTIMVAGSNQVGVVNSTSTILASFNVAVQSTGSNVYFSGQTSSTRPMFTFKVFNGAGADVTSTLIKNSGFIIPTNVVTVNQSAGNFYIPPQNSAQFNNVTFQFAGKDASGNLLNQGPYSVEIKSITYSLDNGVTTVTSSIMDNVNAWRTPAVNP